ncbi:RICIN domain-containing protein, partial [Plantactinospora sp. KLBMP9567]|uniref:RICIN domain-containing protein n=1 Tax=Plantactinospora sp. KLBMP9567 TaxID=3085900 RepID=UPI0029816A8B
MFVFGTSPSIAPPSRRRGWLTRIVAAGVTAVVVGGAAAVVLSTPAAAATVDTSAWYVLVNRNSGKALDVYNLATNDGARIVQWARNNG